MSNKRSRQNTKSSNNNASNNPSNNSSNRGKEFKIELLNSAQKLAWAAFQKHDVLFLIGPAGTGKTFLATAFAIKSLLSKECERIVLTRPIVEAGESLGFLPGDFEEKVNPYMMPMYDCIDKLIGYGENPQKTKIMERTEVAPLAYMRGRSQPFDANILTPNGYKKMGEIVVNDLVIDSDGQPTKVEGVYPQGELDIYKITFTDNVSVECSADHLWDTTTLYERRYKKGFSTKTTIQIMNKIKQGHAYNHQIPVCKPVNFITEGKLPIDPYVLGVLLGDGNLHEQTSITFSSVDEQIVEELRKRTGLSIQLSETREDKCPNYRISCISGKNYLRTAIKNLELLGSKSNNKFIPDIFKTTSISNRLEILRGLMDSDGCCFEQKGKRKPRVQYYSTSENLAQDVASIVYSLGGTASVKRRKFTEKDSHMLGKQLIKHNHDLWVVSIRMFENPFKLNRKAEKFIPLQPLRSIKSIEKVGRKECQCIKVSAKNSLYLTDHCIVTHNTFDDSVCVFDEAQNATISQLKLFMTRFGQHSKLIITGDPRQSDIGRGSGLAEVVHRLKGVVGIGVIEFQNNSIVRHPLIGEILNRLEDTNKEDM